jgi:drug/metabolite transporter (DMT)-like permease
MTHHWGYVGAFTSAVLFGISSTLNKIALENVHPLVIAGMIYFVGGILLLHAMHACMHHQEREEQEMPWDMTGLILLIIVGCVFLVVVSLWKVRQLMMKGKQGE